MRRRPASSALRSRPAPRCQTWPPSTHVQAIGFVGRSESSTEGRLLVEDNEQMERDQHHACVRQQRGLAKEHSLPQTIATTQTYMGFRTNRYRPDATSASVCSTGPGVPRPSRAKRAKQSTRQAKPTPTATMPTTRSPGSPSKVAWNVQPTSANGTTPATSPGATRKNTSDPRTARVRVPFSNTSETPRDFEHDVQTA